MATQSQINGHNIIFDTHPPSGYLDSGRDGEFKPSSACVSVLRNQKKKNMQLSLIAFVSSFLLPRQQAADQGPRRLRVAHPFLPHSYNCITFQPPHPQGNH